MSDDNHPCKIHDTFYCSRQILRYHLRNLRDEFYNEFERLILPIFEVIIKIINRIKAVVE